MVMIFILIILAFALQKSGTIDFDKQIDGLNKTQKTFTWLAISSFVLFTGVVPFRNPEGMFFNFLVVIVFSLVLGAYIFKSRKK